MPAYIDLIRIDWHLAETPVDRHAVISGVDARCTASDHTLETVREQLGHAAATHPWLVADALVDTGYNSFAFLRVRDGRVELEEIVEVPEGTAERIDLPYDELPFDLSPVYASEDELRDALEAIRPDEAGSFVATAGTDRFLVELTPETWTIQKLEVLTDPALFARLVKGDYPVPRPAPRGPEQKYGQALFWPEAMLHFLEQHATQLDRSLSWLVQYAIKVANLETLDDAKVYAARIDAKLSSGETRQQTLYFPGAQLDLLEEQALRLDMSMSKLAQTAVAIAKREIEKMPDRVEPGFG